MQQLHRLNLDANVEQPRDEIEAADEIVEPHIVEAAEAAHPNAIKFVTVERSGGLTPISRQSGLSWQSMLYLAFRKNNLSGMQLRSRLIFYLSAI